MVYFVNSYIYTLISSSGKNKLIPKPAYGHAAFQPVFQPVMIYRYNEIGSYCMHNNYKARVDELYLIFVFCE